MKAFPALFTALLISGAGIGAANAADGLAPSEAVQSFRDRASRTLHEGHRGALERRSKEARMKAKLNGRKVERLGARQGLKPGADMRAGQGGSRLKPGAGAHGHTGLGNKDRERAMKREIMARKLAAGGPPAGFQGRAGAGGGYDGSQGGPPAGFQGRAGAGGGYDGSQGGPPAGFQGRAGKGPGAGGGYDGSQGGPPAGFQGRAGAGGSRAPAGDDLGRLPPPDAELPAPGGALLPEPEDNPYFSTEGEA